MATIEEFYKRDFAFKSDFVVTASGDLDTVTGLENLKDALYRRLITHPGSLVHRPNYGVGIKDYQNAPGSLAVQRRLALRIQEQFERDPRVEKVTGVSVNVPDSLKPDLFKVTVRVKPAGYDETQMQFIAFGDV